MKTKSFPVGTKFSCNGDRFEVIENDPEKYYILCKDVNSGDIYHFNDMWNDDIFYVRCRVATRISFERP